ncbi:MAG: restriction endonuclease [Thermoanaerobacteraceae bacterium]|nr:restriction endonuclease [Thermoanaerobacteraceae bacterium]
MSIDFSTYHYPPDLLNLLVDTLPLLNRSKRDLILFFKGAGVEPKYISDIEEIVSVNRDSISKYEIARTILERLNEAGDKTLRARREIIKRVVEFEDFSCCWESDILKAKGAVAEVRKIINVKDSFTRMKLEREKERLKRQQEYMKELEMIQKRSNELRSLKEDFFRLFQEQNAQQRGRSLEYILNSLFKIYNMIIKESFTVKGENKEGIIEQIDGAIELDGEVYLVEMKWLKNPVDVSEISQHLVRIYHRSYARGIFISASGYTKAAIATCKEALQKTIIVLCKLEELVLLLEQEKDFKEFLKSKVNASITDKNPLYEPLKVFLI